LFVLGIVPMLALVVNMAFTASLTKKLTEKKAVQGALAQEMLAAIRTVFSFGMQEEARHKYDEAARATNKVGIR
jgi:hypothetical protein